MRAENGLIFSLKKSLSVNLFCKKKDLNLAITSGYFEVMYIQNNGKCKESKPTDFSFYVALTFLLKKLILSEITVG